MNWRFYVLLAVLGLFIVTIVAAFQSAPGYMDADYYYAGGLQLAHGHGFTEPYLWNYLDNPTGLPHASHAYWMPLASLLAAAGALISSIPSWTGARLGFLIVAAAIPPLTAGLAWSFTSQRELALTSGLLAVFPAFYLPFLPVTDTFGIYMLLGGFIFLLLGRMILEKGRITHLLVCFLLGLAAGLMHLSRADGLLWLLVGLAAVLLFQKSARFAPTFLLSFVMVIAGYLVVMVPWFVRNAAAFGSPLGPGSMKMLWLTSYDQLFSYPAEGLTFHSWWQSGLAAIVRARSWALGINLQRILAEQGEIFLLPLIGIGLWHLRKDIRIQLAFTAWVLTILAMTFAFPFAGARGGFFHSGAALQPMWWAMAPIGLDEVIKWGKLKRGWNSTQAGRVFRPAIIAFAVLLTCIVLWGRFSSNGQISSQSWSSENIAYSQIAKYLTEEEGVLDSQTIMVANPPGFYLASGLSAIAIPNGGVDKLLQVANKYDADYLVLEADGLTAELGSVYSDPDNQTDLIYLGQVGNARIFYIHHP